MVGTLIFLPMTLLASFIFLNCFVDPKAQDLITQLSPQQTVKTQNPLGICPGSSVKIQVKIQIGMRVLSAVWLNYRIYWFVFTHSCLFMILTDK